MTANTRGMSAALLGAALLLWSAPTAAQILGQDNITANGQAVAFMAIPANTGAVTFTISGTWTGTLQLEVTADGTNWVASAALPSAGGATVSSTTSTGVWSILNYGFVGYRARASAFASGTAVVSATAGKQVALSGTVTVADITSSGQIKAANGTIAAPGYSWSSIPNTGLYLVAGSTFAVSVGGNSVMGWTFNGPQLRFDKTVDWSSGNVNSATDVSLARDAAGFLAQRNGANPQLFRVYNTFTDASNYERLDLGWSSNVAFIRAANAGTGTGRVLSLDSPAGLQFRIAGIVNWSINSSGHFTAGTDNAFDIGASGASRPRDIWIAGTVNSNGAILGSADVRAGATGGFYWLGRSILASPADGNVRLTNAAVTDFGLLQFGGTTSAFPALKRSGALLQARLADDSGFAQISASTVNIATALSGTNPIIFVAAPTISSGFGTSPTVPNANGSSAFVINVGTGGAATAGVIGLSAAATGWNCNITDITAAVNHTGLRTWQTASTTTTATIESQNSAGAATAWATGSLLRVSCFAY